MKLRYIFLALFLTVNLSAHTLLMNVFNNDDNTITVIGEFSNGQKAAGAMIRLESLATGEILFKKRLPDESEITIDIPKEEYQVVLDGGPGHQIVKDGIAPLEGFSIKASKEAKKKLSQPRQRSNELGMPLIILLSLGFLFIALALYFSAKNTKTLMAQLKK